MENYKNIISDELLAAYLEGKTTREETSLVLNALKTNPEIREMLDIALHLEEENIVKLPAMQLAAESGENLCSVMCEAYVLYHRGIEFDENKLLDTAKKNHWFKRKY